MIASLHVHSDVCHMPSIVVKEQTSPLFHVSSCSKEPGRADVMLTLLIQYEHSTTIVMLDMVMQVNTSACLVSS